MLDLPDLFVTPHAIAQFRQRIAPMDEARARQIILRGIREATNVHELPDGTLRVRTKRPFPFEFRAFCVFDTERGHRVVTTIVRGDSNITREHKRRRESPHSDDQPQPHADPEG